MKCYETYKASGLDWLERIPLRWRVDRIKDLAEIITGNTPPKDDPDNYYDGTIPWIKPDQLRGSVVYDSDEKLSDKGTSSARLVPKNAILVGCIGDVGNFAIAGCSLATNQQINSLVFGGTIDKSFSKYLIEGLKDEHKKHSTLVVVPILNKSRQGQIYLIIPDKESQLNISAYLDKQCAAIDKVLEGKREQLTVLEDLRKSIIHKAVTKGLDDSVEMKDSGIEWIGKMPNKWKVDRIKDVVSLRNTKTDEKDEIENYIELEDMEQKTGRLLSMRNTIGVESDVIVFEKGDVLFGKLRPYLEKHHYAEFNGRCTGEIFAFKPERVDEKFFYYCVASPWFISRCDVLSYGAKMPRVNWPTQIAVMDMPIPSHDEQVEIAKFLDKEIKGIFCLMDNIKQQIDVLGGYRKSLIHECVTGKRRVSEIDLKELANV